MYNALLPSLLVLGPIVFGLLAWMAPGWKTRGFLVTMAAFLTAALGITVVWHYQGGHIWTMNRLDPWIPWAIAILELGINLVIALIGLRIRSAIIFTLGLASFAMGIAAEWVRGHGHIAGRDMQFILDPLSSILVLIVTIVGSAIILFAIGYMKHHEEHAPPTAASTGKFFFFLVSFLGVMNGLVLADNLQWLGLFWEATTLCSFYLIGHDGTEEARNNAKRALLINSIGGVAIMFATLLAAAGNHEATITWMTTHNSLALIPMVMLAIAALTKSAQMPFQSWLLGAMVAPTPVSALLHSATLVKAGSYLILRLAPAFAGYKLMALVALAGAFTFAVTAALAVSQSNAKKVLAYSTISNLGLIVACAGINTPIAYVAALMILCFHAMSKALLFLCVGTIEQRIGSRDIEDMGELMFKMPLTAVIATIGMVSMLIPPFGMLLSKWMAIESAVSSPIFLFLLAIGSALTVLFWAKWLGRVQTVTYQQCYTVEKLPLSMFTANIFLVIMVIAAGVAAIPIYREILIPIAMRAYSDVIVPPAALALMQSAERLMVWPMIAFIAIGLIAFLIAKCTFKPSQIRLPFLCGENVPIEKTSEEREMISHTFIGPGDVRNESWAATLYMPTIFNEDRITFWGNLVAGMLLVAILGIYICM